MHGGKGKIQSTCGTETSPGGLGIEHEGAREAGTKRWESVSPSKGAPYPGEADGQSLGGGKIHDRGAVWRQAGLAAARVM